MPVALLKPRVGTREQAAPDESSFVSQFEPLLQAIAIVAQGDTFQHDELEEVLTELDAKGWHLKAAAQRLWEGERDDGRAGRTRYYADFADSRDSCHLGIDWQSLKM